jgi:transcriptional regulator with XRE-family HTH domain
MTEPFATTLRRALDERGITASDLARRIWGSEDNGAGARNRQSVCQYLAGKTRPKLATVERIAAALQMPLVELVPSLGPPDKVSVEASFENDKVRLRIDRSVDAATAVKILGILSA